MTEEVWSWWQPGSVHRTAWPAPEVGWVAGGDGLLDDVGWALGEIRRAKTDAKLSMRAPVERVVLQAPDEVLAALRQAEGDLKEAGSVAEVVYRPGEEPAVEVCLAAAPE